MFDIYRQSLKSQDSIKSFGPFKINCPFTGIKIFELYTLSKFPTFSEKNPTYFGLWGEGSNTELKIHTDFEFILVYCASYCTVLARISIESSTARAC